MSGIVSISSCSTLAWSNSMRSGTSSPTRLIWMIGKLSVLCSEIMGSSAVVGSSGFARSTASRTSASATSRS